MDKQTVTLIISQAWLDLLKITISADLVGDVLKLSCPDEGENPVSDRYKER